MLSNLKNKVSKLKGYIICILISVIMTLIGLMILYTYIPRSSTDINNVSDSNIVLVKDYFIAGINGSISKHVYILTDKETKLMYMQIDTLQDNKVVASSQSEVYNKKNDIMTYREYLDNEGLLDEQTTNLNNKVQIVKPPVQQSDATSKENSGGE